MYHPQTLQAITLVHTLLNDGPTGKPAVNRAIIVAPSSLVDYWRREFIKWLGRERIQPRIVQSEFVYLPPDDYSSPWFSCPRFFVLRESHETQTEIVRDFVRSSNHPVLVIGYEMFRKHAKLIAPLRRAIIICDEGHRLKNSAGNRTVQGELRSPRVRPESRKLKRMFAMYSIVFVCDEA